MAPRGLRAARSKAEHIQRQGVAPAVVLCSRATAAREIPTAAVVTLRLAIYYPENCGRQTGEDAARSSCDFEHPGTGADRSCQPRSAGLSSSYTRKRLRRSFLRCSPVELPSGALDRIGGAFVSDVLAVPHLLAVGRTPKDGSVVGTSLQLNVGWLKVWSHVGDLNRRRVERRQPARWLRVGEWSGQLLQWTSPVASPPPGRMVER